MFTWIVEELISYLTDNTQLSYYKDWLVVQDFQAANRCSFHGSYKNWILYTKNAEVYNNKGGGI